MNDTTFARTESLMDAVDTAASCIGTLYPLTNFIACNALKNLEDLPFEKAMEKAGSLFGANCFLPLTSYRVMYESGRIDAASLQEAFHRHQHRISQSSQTEIETKTIAELLDQLHNCQIVESINKQMIKWCSAYLDCTQSQWSAGVEGRLYTFWKQLAGHDLSLSGHGISNWSLSVRQSPSTSEQAIEDFIVEAGLNAEQIIPYLSRHFIQLPGFASHLKWRRTEHLDTTILADFLAIRLQYEKFLCQSISRKMYKHNSLALLRSSLEACPESQSARKSESGDYSCVWQEAYELSYRNQLLSSLKPETLAQPSHTFCQIVFCIDVRSEPVRRELEAKGPYSTYGFAGFFGMPMKLTELGSQTPLNLCPVLLVPDKSVNETSDEAALVQKMSWQSLKVSALELKKKLKCNLAGAFGLVDLFGIFSALPLALNTFFPSHFKQVLRRLESTLAGTTKTRLDLSAFSLEEKVALARGAITGIGLKKFGKVVVFCGHKSSSVNNPYASSLDCGACGANGGQFSARLAADILNEAAVRDRLRETDLVIPNDTLFVAAEHDTTTDQFKVFADVALSDEHSTILHQLSQDFAEVGKTARSRKAKLLPSGSLPHFDAPQERACDWAQVVPEWGLAGNAAFIAAPRSLTQTTDLQGRVFLHSYDCQDDRDSKVLEVIMTAPLVVAQWINMQYYLSTVDNKKFGSGSKVTHNVVGDFGVMRGAASDLQIGLPMQSVMTESQLVHEPMRLLALLRAPVEAIDAVLHKNPQVRKLVDNRWIRVIAMNPSSNEFYEAFSTGEWHRIDLHAEQKKSDVETSYQSNRTNV